eukprot:959090-Prorocentrum_minimum.AAC.1
MRHVCVCVLQPPKVDKDAKPQKPPVVNVKELAADAVMVASASLIHQLDAYDAWMVRARSLVVCGHQCCAVTSVTSVVRSP